MFRSSLDQLQTETTDEYKRQGQALHYVLIYHEILLQNSWNGQKFACILVIFGTVYSFGVLLLYVKINVKR